MANETGGAAAETMEGLEKKSPEELAGQLQEETEKAGGRLSMVETFGVKDVEFTKPLNWGEKTWERAHMDFIKLTGAEMEAIDDEMSALNMGALPAEPTNSRKYLRLLAAKASGIPSMAIKTLPAADYNAMITAARYFLMASQI